MTTLADTDPDAALGPLQAAACTYRIALGPRAGQKVLSLKTVPSQEAQLTQQRCVNEQGFSLHAEVRCAINQRHKLESQGQGWALLGAPRTQHLCRYITRPAIANDKPDTWMYRCQLLRTERLTLNRAGQVALTLKTPYRDGTTHVVMSPLEFMQRLAALVPRPRLHLIRFHGVLATPSDVPRPFHPRDAKQGHSLALAIQARRSTPMTPQRITLTRPALDADPHRISWAWLLKRVFGHHINCSSHRRGDRSRSHHPPLSSNVRASDRRRRAPASSGVRSASSIATRKDTGHRYRRVRRVSRPRIRTSQWGLGRSQFRVQDLIDLAALLRGLR